MDNSRDLTTSPVDRRNILNNQLALEEIAQRLSPNGFLFDGILRFSKAQVAHFYEVDVRTVERILEQHGEEISESGYELFGGVRLRKLKDAVALFQAKIKDVSDIHVGDILELSGKAPSIGIFSYKSLINVGMLLTDSEQARQLRAAMLNIVLDVLNRRLGGSTKYINQREEEFVPSAVREHNYRQEFTNALDDCITPNNFKYSQLTDRIYISIFKENTKEYKQILKLRPNDSVRSTLYSEVLDLIASYENGFAECLCKEHIQLGRKLGLSEAVELFRKFEQDSSAIYRPLLERARGLMASRDMAFRDALHEKLKDYVGALPEAEFNKFLGEKSQDLKERLLENQDVFKRLRDR
jgi:hypothetical protein